ncbi:MAG TPA: hypothetical protein VG245_00075 [Candidatus Dormibacteraeota bacterium]|nr:hypothetical protein [Candidatus Dormibacteraeota bacterium]
MAHTSTDRDPLVGKVADEAETAAPVELVVIAVSLSPISAPAAW